MAPAINKVTGVELSNPSNIILKGGKSLVVIHTFGSTQRYRDFVILVTFLIGKQSCDGG